MSYILALESNPEGVFSIIDSDTGEYVIPIFDEKDDAERYALQIVDSGSDHDLAILEIKKDYIINACEEKSQKYAIITTDDLIVPPINTE